MSAKLSPHSESSSGIEPLPGGSVSHCRVWRKATYTQGAKKGATETLLLSLASRNSIQLRIQGETYSVAVSYWE